MDRVDAPFGIRILQRRHIKSNMRKYLILLAFLTIYCSGCGNAPDPNEPRKHWNISQYDVNGNKINSWTTHKRAVYTTEGGVLVAFLDDEGMIYLAPPYVAEYHWEHPWVQCIP